MEADGGLQVVVTDAASTSTNAHDASSSPLPRASAVLPGRSSGHVPVLCEASVEVVVEAGGADGAYADCTFGRGGHTRALLARLSPHGRVFAFDVDPTAVAEARRLAARENGRLIVLHRPFGDLDAALPQGLDLSGVVADIGLSSPQIDQKHRGFSVLEDGPLDLRMNPCVGVPAADWLMDVSAEELAWVIREYGEDEDPLLAGRIAEAVTARVRRAPPALPLRRTKQLVDVVCAAKAELAENPFQQPARLTFQALRTHLNCEFQQLESLLASAAARLTVSGRIAVLCFKRAEVAVVRRFLRQHEEPLPDVVADWPCEKLPKLYPLLSREPAPQYCVAEVCKPLVPSPEELRANTRARSAQCLVLEKRTRRFRLPGAAT
eukprot:gnl/TRDRNA2_/TRDRNA2_173841_c1_seq1.p1 gnl/TRDRNA2_/TRDRNA2_173841_c1~~gnl/TRDRNA2_/TRDRNA2_173841_c1_seq1.p1  ORF type:complete len:379 (+),score=79.63 gnl/TRDRNA2_/TRDRNA2_173841_c1_seq1:77-1213(+)